MPAAAGMLWRKFSQLALAKSLHCHAYRGLVACKIHAYAHLVKAHERAHAHAASQQRSNAVRCQILHRGHAAALLVRDGFEGGLGRDLAVIGAGTRAEIWDAQSWREYLAVQEDVFSNQAEEVIPGMF